MIGLRLIHSANLAYAQYAACSARGVEKYVLANSCGKCKTNAARKVAASEATKPPISQAVKQSVCPSVSQSTCLVTDTEEGKHSLSAASLGLAAAASKLCQSDESVRSRSKWEQEQREQAGCGCQAKSAFGLRKMQFAGK